MPYKLPALPYDADRLEPHISMKTVLLHYGKHHQGYVDKLNGATNGTDLDNENLDTIIQAAQDKTDQFLFNNAAQVWNHNFFWNSMSPEPSEPSAELAAAIEESFEGIDGFEEGFKKAATEQFGSGWTWLTVANDSLAIMNTSNADLPLAHGTTALACCDVWEHAYYLDYQNDRGKFVETFLKKLINWDFASKNWHERDSS